MCLFVCVYVYTFARVRVHFSHDVRNRPSSIIRIRIIIQYPSALYNDINITTNTVSGVCARSAAAATAVSFISFTVAATDAAASRITTAATSNSGMYLLLLIILLLLGIYLPCYVILRIRFCRFVII